MPAGPQVGLDLVGRLLRRAVRHRPSRQRLAQPGGELVAVELLARSVALEDHEAGGFDPLVRS